jgi:hypothetical protein
MYNPQIHLLPFGIHAPAYGGLSSVEGPTHDKVATKVTLLCSPRSPILLSDSHRLEAIRKIRSAMKIINHRPMGFERPNAWLDLDVVSAPWPLWKLLSSEQRTWLYCEAYVQVGHAKLNCLTDAGIGISLATSMTVYDYLALRHHSLNPEDHEPLELCGEDIRCLRVAMGRHFHEGSLLWHSDYVDFRNKVAVMCRAALADEDPVEAYHVFLTQSRPYFLNIEPRFDVGKYETYVTVKGGPEDEILARIC